MANVRKGDIVVVKKVNRITTIAPYYETREVTEWVIAEVHSATREGIAKDLRLWAGSAAKTEAARVYFEVPNAEQQARLRSVFNSATLDARYDRDSLLAIANGEAA